MLTVIMPVYNVERFVAEAVESVLAQTHRDFTLLVCDDGSTDGTAAVVRAIAARDARVVLHTQKNVGIGHTMNAALARCGTEWVACMHGDDVMLPNRLERQLAFVREHPDVDVISSLVEWIDETGRIVGRSRSPLTDPKAVAEIVAAGRTVAFPHPAVMFRRSAIVAVGGYDQEFFPAEDTELWNRAAQAGHKVLVQPEVLLRYRIRASSASMSKAAVMIRKLRWMEESIAARRAGRPVQTWQQFLESRGAAGRWRKFNDDRKDLSRTIYQAAIGHCAARQYHKFVPSLLAATALEPELVLGRVMPRLRRLLPGGGVPKLRPA